MIDLAQLNNVPYIRAYRIRWIILVIYISYSALNIFQWFEYAIINNLVMKYYEVSSEAVDWTAVIFMLVWPIFIFPATYIIDKMGLRVAGLIGALGSCLGAFIKLCSVRRDLFFVVMVGQTVVGISQLFILSLPPMLAVYWFQYQEVATVCSLSFFGLNLGVALGFIIPPLIVDEQENVEKLGSELFTLSLIVAGVLILAAIAVIAYFPKQPPNPPNLVLYELLTQKEAVTPKVYFKSILTVLKNKGFLIHFAAFGINIGIFSAFGILMNLIILNYFKNGERDAGIMGMSMVFGGMAGSVIIGMILDKTHEFKATAIVVFFGGAMSMAGLLIMLIMESKTMSYLAILSFGFFVGAYLPTGIELATELTFPSPESTVAGLVFTGSQCCGLIFTIILRQINQRYGTFYNILVQIIILMIGVVLTYFTPEGSKLRQSVFSRTLE